MKKNNLYNIKWFTLIELIVVITIIWILTISLTKWYWYLINSSEEEGIKSSLQQLWTIFSTIIQKNWDFPYNNYCRNSSWNYDNTSCFQLNSWWWECKWNFSDIWKIECDRGCIMINCSNNFCSWNNSYLDFDKILQENNYWDTTINYWKSFSYKICPFKQQNWNTTIWKWSFSQIQTSNPSFSFFYNWNLIYEYNSNP